VLGITLDIRRGQAKPLITTGQSKIHPCAGHEGPERERERQRERERESVDV